VAEATPVAEGVRGQLGPVVHPHELGPAAAPAGDPVEHPDGVVGIDAPLDLDRQGFAGVLVDEPEQLQHPPVAGGIELEVERPDVVGRSARRRSAGIVEVPSRCRLRLRAGTRRPSSRHSRWIFLRFACQPASRSDAHAFR